jgi:hypothetical protein
MHRNDPLWRHRTNGPPREPPSWPVLALCAALPVALVVLLSAPLLSVAGLAALATAVALRRLWRRSHTTPNPSRLFVVSLSRLLAGRR